MVSPMQSYQINEPKMPVMPFFAGIREFRFGIKISYYLIKIHVLRSSI